MTDTDIRRFSARAELEQAAAGLILELAQEAVAARGRFVLALPGGRTPLGVYARLLDPGVREGLPWDRTHVFMGDERMVPLDDPQSNFGQARAALFSRAVIPTGNLHPMPVQVAPLTLAARTHAEELTAFFDGPPVFDLCFLGLGPDGHTASLFPDRLSLDAIGVVAAEPEPGLDPQVPRLTLTFPAINASRAVLICAAGTEKLAVAERVLADPEGAAEDVPAALVRPRGRLFWFLSC